MNDDVIMGQQMFDLPKDDRVVYPFNDYLKSQGILMGGYNNQDDKKIMKKIYEQGYIFHCDKNNFKAEKI